MFHSQDFDLDRCREASLATEETSAPKWFAFVIGGVGSLYLATAILAFACLR